MFELEDENVLFLYCWTLNEMQIPATRDRSRRRATAQTGTNGARPRPRPASIQPVVLA
jgi:hypothetical protein